MCRIKRLLHFVSDFVAHHILTRLKQCHILFETRNIQLQLIKRDRQPLIAEIQIFTGVLRIVE
ncbi:hypothetical protein D3C87_2014680 [compost metagenome]